MTGLVIERVADRDSIDAWHRVSAAALATDHVGLPVEPIEEFEERMRDVAPDQRIEFWLGCCDGAAIVVGKIIVPVLDNLESATVDVQVHPGFRRRGYGRAMFAHLSERARTHGRRRIFSEISQPLEVAVASSGDGGPALGHAIQPGAAFGHAMGGRPVTNEIRRVLTMTELDEVGLGSLRAEATAAAAGYSLMQWVDRAPGETLDDLAVLMSRMTTDAPLEDMDWEPEVWSAQRYRDQEDTMIARGRRRIVTAARHDETGRLVGYTDIGVNVRQPDVAFQWATIVLHAHRGHRLGMLLKLANLDFLRQTYPEVAFLNTWNAAVNNHMVAINEAMGFRAVERWREWQLELLSAQA